MLTDSARLDANNGAGEDEPTLHRLPPRNLPPKSPHEAGSMEYPVTPLEGSGLPRTLRGPEIWPENHHGKQYSLNPLTWCLNNKQAA